MARPALFAVAIRALRSSGDDAPSMYLWMSPMLPNLFPSTNAATTLPPLRWPRVPERLDPHLGCFPWYSS